MKSTLSVGVTGCGKTQEAISTLLRLGESREAAVFVLDGKGDLAFQLTGQYSAAGLERFVEYEDLASADGKVLPLDFLPGPWSADAFRREIEEELIREEFKQIFLARKGLLSDEDKGFTREGLDLCVGVMQAQAPRKRLDWITKVLEPDTAEFEQLRDECLAGEGAGELRKKMLRAAHLAKRSPTQFDVWSGAPRRMLEAVRSPAFRARCSGDYFDLAGAARDKKLILYSGAGVPRAAARLIFLSVALMMLNAARRYYSLHQRPLPVVLVLEECGAYGLAAPFVLTALQELRAAGVAVWVMTQSTLDFEPPVLEKILQNTPGGHKWFRLLSPRDQETAAADLFAAKFDPAAEHYRRARLQHDGYEAKKNVTRAHGTGESGTTPEYGPKVTNNKRQDVRDTVTESTTYLSRYREVEDVFYKSPQLQEAELRAEAGRLGVGEFYLRDLGGAYKVQAIMEAPSWPLGLADKRTREAIARIRSRPHYQTPGPSGSTPPTPDGPRDASRFLT